MKSCWVLSRPSETILQITENPDRAKVNAGALFAAQLSSSACKSTLKTRILQAAYKTVDSVEAELTCESESYDRNPWIVRAVQVLQDPHSPMFRV